MSIRSIPFALEEKFHAPPGEFYKRHIVFWHDEEGEFEELFGELELPGVQCIKLTGRNSFAVKKRLLHDDPEGNYLIYVPFAYERPEDNWLRDIELYSESYRADLVSMQMDELGMAPDIRLRKAVKGYGKFLGNKERMQKLKRLGLEYQSPTQLHIAVLSVLAGCAGGSFQQVLITVLAAGEEENGPLDNIRRFGDRAAFWELVQKYTGCNGAEKESLEELGTHILLTALDQTAGSGMLKGLERYVSQANRAFCHSLVQEWREGDRRDALWERCRAVEQALRLPARFDGQEVEALLHVDIFPAIHESILKQLLEQVSQQVIRTDLLLEAAENRRTAGWYEHFADYYECLSFLARMQSFHQEHPAGFHMTAPEEIWRFYTETAWEMDRFYRGFHTAFGRALRSSHPVLEDELKQAAGYVEGLYKNWFLAGLTDNWTGAVGEELASLGYVSALPRQRDFYGQYVRPLTEQRTRVFVIISDALRYEVAVQLRQELGYTAKGTTKLEAVQAMFPSVTKVGMAALLPGNGISFNEQMEVLVDGLSTRSTADRERILCRENPNSVAATYGDILAMKRAQRRELVSGKEVVYIYHNTIDATGDKQATENKVFDACDDTVQELVNLLRILVNDMQAADILITADHGFLYTYEPLEEGDKLSQSAFHGAVYELGRRYALTDPAAGADFLLPVHLEGERAAGYTPRESIRLKLQGGGENYVHGGVSLQEMVVPVIAYKNLRTSSKTYVEVSNAELRLLTDRRKITNLLFSLEFFQRQPVGEKIQPCTYALYMTDENGVPVSDRQTVIADRTSPREADRVFRVRFNLKAGAYSKDKIYRLVVANDTDVPVETEFQIDIAYADDFHF